MVETCRSSDENEFAVALLRVDYRNPNLAEALRVLGFVQRFGFGIPTARRELERNGNPPLEFEVASNRVLVRVGMSGNYLHGGTG